MRMDEWIAAFGSDELSWADEEEEPFNGILSTSSSWCDGNILWVPATEKTEDDALDYSCSESSTEASQCSQQACNLHCVCVDCLKCPDHCTCNYSKNDYQCRATAGRKKNDTKQNEIRSESSRSQSSFWSAHFPSFSRSKKESPNKGFMVVPNNICVEAFYVETTASDESRGPSNGPSLLDSPPEERHPTEELEQTLKATFGAFDDYAFNSRSNSDLSWLQPREIFP